MLALLALLACTGKEYVPDPARYACDHTGKLGTNLHLGQAVGDAPVIPMNGEPHTALFDVQQVVYYLAIQVEQDMEAVLFAGTPDVISGLLFKDQPVDLPPPSPSDVCPDEIPEHYDLELTMGTWYLKLGATAEESIWLTLADAEGHEHEED